MCGFESAECSSAIFADADPPALEPLCGRCLAWWQWQHDCARSPAERLERLVTRARRATGELLSGPIQPFRGRSFMELRVSRFAGLVMVLAVVLGAAVGFDAEAEGEVAPVVDVAAGVGDAPEVEPPAAGGGGYRPGRLSTGWLETDLVVELNSPSHACRVSESTTTSTPGGAQVRVRFACPPRSEVP